MVLKSQEQSIMDCSINYLIWVWEWPMKIMLKSKPSSWMICLTCDFWAGERKPSPFGDAVKYYRDVDKGVCLEPGWDRSQKIAMRRCCHWKKWGVLN
jgi:hypothetical protein